MPKPHPTVAREDDGRREGQQPFTPPIIFSRIRNVSGVMRLLTLCVIALLVTGCDLFPPSGAKSTTITSTSTNTSTSRLATSSTLTQSPASSLSTTELPSVPTAVPTSSVPITANASMSQAWGQQIQTQMKHIPVVSSANNYFLIPQSVTQDGKFLLATSNPSDTEDNPNRPARGVVIIDIASGQSTVIGKTPNATIEPYEVYSDDNWIIWTQAPQEPGFFSDWVMYAYNRANHSTKEIARAAKNKDGMPVVGDGSARIDHGRVVWVEAALPDAKGVQHTLVKMMDMQTGQVTTLSSSGLLPTISWPHVAWVEVQLPPEGAPTPAPGQAKAVVTVLNIEDGVKKVLIKPDKPSYMALYKNSFVWISSDHKRVLLTDLDETFEQTIDVVRGGDYFQDPFVNDRLITWGSQSTVIVWDRKQKQLITVASKDAGHNSLAPRDLLWVSPPPDSPGVASEINILDTTQLP